VNDDELGREIKYLQNAMGGVLGPQDCWLLLRGIKTLKVRMDAQQQGAEQIARWLASKAEVKRVYYPGLDDSEQSRIHRMQSDGSGAVLSFDVGSGERARTLLKHVTLPLVAVSLGGVESILSYPAMMSHAAMPANERERRGITDGLIRLSVGLEDPSDIITDIEQAFLA